MASASPHVMVLCAHDINGTSFSSLRYRAYTSEDHFAHRSAQKKAATKMLREEIARRAARTLKAVAYGGHLGVTLVHIKPCVRPSPNILRSWRNNDRRYEILFRRAIRQVIAAPRPPGQGLKEGEEQLHRPRSGCCRASVNRHPGTGRGRNGRDPG